MLVIACQSEIRAASKSQLADSSWQVLRSTGFSAIMRLSWFDDFDRGTHWIACFFLSPARLADHHVGPFRLDPESLRGVGSVLREDGL